jgi:dethiobiotin synthetase
MSALPKNIFVSGIDTHVGKTIVSAILAEALHADYWKPVQAGDTGQTDSDIVKGLVSNKISKVHKEAYSLHAATVPYYAASLEKITIDNITLPITDNRLIIEGAGGLMVHLRKDFMVIDLIHSLGLPVILVSKNYLGSINHTLLSIEALRRRNIVILGMIYSGERSDHMRELITHTGGIAEIGSISQADAVTKEFVQHQAAMLRVTLGKHFTI